jgi:Protein of unknown function (DUF1257)
MSAYGNLETQYKDQQCLVEALAEVGYKEVEIHEGEGANLVGYHGDTRQQKANVIIRRKHIGGASNDIGFKKQPNGTFSAIISDYDSHRHGAKWLTDLKRNYTEKVVVKEAKRQGLKPYKTTTVGGKKVIQYLVA